jgi:serine O-acetyltransferase
VNCRENVLHKIRDDTIHYLDQELAYVIGPPSSLKKLLILFKLVLVTPGYQFVLSRRIQELLLYIPMLGRPLRRIVWWLTCLVFGSEIAISCEVGGGLYIPHPFGIVVGVSDIGKRVTILQNVTIGRKSLADKERPRIGDGAQLSAGAVIVGSITIGHHSIVGANSVVTRDIPPHSLAIGIPATISPLAMQAGNIESTAAFNALG